MSTFNKNLGRRTVLKGGLALTAAAVAPVFFTRHAFGAEFRNNPGSSGHVTLGFNVPQTGPYSDEGVDELRAYTSGGNL